MHGAPAPAHEDGSHASRGRTPTLHTGVRAPKKQLLETVTSHSHLTTLPPHAALAAPFATHVVSRIYISSIFHQCSAIMKSAALIASLALAPATSLVAPAAPVRPASALMARQPITGGNWKMNPTSLDDARELAKSVAAAAGSSAAEGIVFPPYPFIGPVGEIIKDTKLNLGSQSIFFEDKGAYTGAVSASMVKSLGVKYVLAGHSERRTLFKDNDAAINKKVRCRVSCRVASMASRRVYAPRGRRDGVFARPRRIDAVGAAAREVHEPRESGVATHRS